ncbi:(4Fe-4S)-binding protein [Tsukamurella sp. DT100]|uniref:(4Fe-4S)-binding protein n=1 Tax=Tsukamurella sp. DT100 TaxID=3393415 RepID=UPI003CF3FCEB
MTEGTDRPRIIEYAGNGFVITWEPARCRHAAECVRGLPTVFDNTRRPWIVTDGATVDEVVTVVDRCPSYALGYRTADGRWRSAPAGA